VGDLVRTSSSRFAEHSTACPEQRRSGGGRRGIRGRREARRICSDLRPVLCHRALIVCGVFSRACRVRSGHGHLAVGGMHTGTTHILLVDSRTRRPRAARHVSRRRPFFVHGRILGPTSGVGNTASDDSRVEVQMKKIIRTPK